MEGCIIKFKADTTSAGGYLKFNCKVDYPKTLDPFLPPELKKQTDRKDSVIMPFSGGQGGFIAGTLEQAESLEVELKSKIQDAYEGMLEWQQRVGQWAGAREYELVGPDLKKEFSPRAALGCLAAHVPRWHRYKGFRRSSTINVGRGTMGVRITTSPDSLLA